MVMEGCRTCENWDKEHSGMIIKNEFARATTGGSFREGHCVVTVKRHMISPSEMNPEEWSATFELISKVSKALEEKYGVRKTYVMMIGDSKEWQHLHFHLIPKHHHLPSMGVYCIQKLEEAEGTFDTTPEQKKELASELKTLL